MSDADCAFARTVVVGDLRVTALCDAWLEAVIWRQLRGPESGWSPVRERFPWAFEGEDRWRFHVHAFLLRTPTATVLVDVGVGDKLRGWARLGFADPSAVEVRRSERLLASLGVAGVSPEEVGHVVLTHLHLDHTGWAWRDGAVTFARAVHHVQRDELERFRAHPLEEEREQFRLNVQPLQTSGALRVSAGETEVAPGVRIVPTPGHTPGHTSVLIATGGVDRMLVTGDLFLHPLQLRDPGFADLDEEPERVRLLRVAILERAERDGLVLAVSHFADPFGRVVRVDGARAWESA